MHLPTVADTQVKLDEARIQILYLKLPYYK